MITIRIVSWVHMLWGLTMIWLNAVPRPFGSLEPFLQHLPPTTLGVILVILSIVALLGSHNAHKLRRSGMVWAAPLSAVPQQFALFWGVAWAVLVLMEKFDARTLYGCEYQTILAIFHFIGLKQLYAAAIIETEVGHAPK